MDEQLTSRRQVLSGLGAAGASLLGLGLALNASSAEAANKDALQQGPSTPLPPNIKSVQGSWLGTLQLSDGRVSRGMATFTSNGGMVTTNQIDFMHASPRGTGHGNWKQDGLQVTHRLFKFVGNEEGVTVGIYEELGNTVLDESGDKMVMNAAFTVHGLDGSVVASGNLTINAVRISIDGVIDFGQ